VGHKVALRHTPELVFVEDRTTEKAIALSKVLAETAATSGAEGGEDRPAPEMDMDKQ
jgi:hypothetical protein